MNCNRVTNRAFKYLNFRFKSSLNKQQKIGIIDVHTHMYTPHYMNILRKRSSIPKVQTVDGEDRLIILPGEENESTTSKGRKIGQEYWDKNTKLVYMDKHNIVVSIISLANPWLDFVEDNAAESIVQELNDELQSICEESKGKLYGFASLPMRNLQASIKEIKRLKSLSCIKGVILGTSGAGNGLDHQNVREVLLCLEDAKLPIFLHPHYGVGNEFFHDTGHALFLALGFPFETTVSVSRLIVTGALDAMPNLKILVAHAGAALPSLIGRLDSCVAHDLAISNKLLHTPSSYLKRMYFDAISYNTPSLNLLIDLVGKENIMFGSDNPFFPPHEKDIINAVWPSTQMVTESILSLPSQETQEMIASGNAKRIFGL